jgi:hypothetical protein
VVSLRQRAIQLCGIQNCEFRVFSKTSDGLRSNFIQLCQANYFKIGKYRPCNLVQVKNGKSDFRRDIAVYCLPISLEFCPSRRSALASYNCIIHFWQLVFHERTHISKQRVWSWKSYNPIKLFLAVVCQLVKAVLFKRLSLQASLYETMTHLSECSRNASNTHTHFDDINISYHQCLIVSVQWCRLR